MNVFEEITAVSTAILSVALVVLVVFFVVLALRMRAWMDRLEQRFEEAYGDLKPLITKASAISDDVSTVTNTIKENVGAVGDTVSAANEKVRAALAATEARLGEFNALLGIVQGEAEDLFVSTAAAVRGVGRGAAFMRRRRGTDLASDDPDGESGPDDADDRVGEEEHDDSGVGPERGADRGPRIRRRGGPRAS